MKNLDDASWQAVLARDPRADGKFLFAVRTTGIYCRPSCPAKRPKRENAFRFTTPDSAEAAGYRECKRCKPRADAGADARLVREAARLIVDGEGSRLSEVARTLGVSPSKLSRLFAKHAGTTPKKFALERRFEAFKTSARRDGVVAAQYDAGFSAPSRLYAAAARYLGMTPGAYARGGRGETIACEFVETAVGLVAVAATKAGVCAVELGKERRALKRRLMERFPNAKMIPGGTAKAYAGKVREIVERNLSVKDVAVVPQGTAFQLMVWNALREIPAGRTKTYAEVARSIGRPTAARAVARACATNTIALAIPCHRVVGAGGRLSGYRWGVDKKRRLLEIEAESLGQHES